MKLEDYYCLKYADVVADGVIESITFRSVPAEEWYRGLPESSSMPPVTFGVIELIVNSILRGTYRDSVFVFVVPWTTTMYKTNYSAGERIVISANYNSELMGGTYQIWGDSGRFLFVDGKWECQSDSERESVITQQELQELIYETSLPFVISEAELIVEGMIVRKTVEFVKNEQNEKGTLWVLDVRLLDIKKGSQSENRTIVVRMLKGGLYRPEWRRRIPYNIDVGQRWLMFLKRDRTGWYPFAGSNGLFEVRGNELIYDARRALPLSKTELLALVRGREGSDYD